MISKYKILFFMTPVFLLASSEHANYDIVERTLNFLLFFGILLYFIAKPLKQMYLDRINSIANKLDSIQEKLKASNNKRDEVLRRVEDSKINAANLIETAKKEAIIIKEKIKKESELDILNLEKSFKEQKEFEERKMVKNLVNEILNNIFDNKDLKLDQKELVNIILKKVA
ncbi:ATP synthase, F0 complex, b subunit [Campylobacter pinnipediorum subsp. caledonicus]|uniref:ATP synthase subunit b n=1 Tax=Campylobacter pinnipediorum subsp. caledonicus TaxID=1874362 RepID=A0A1S6U8N9_9BACT|nr:F0F1 ATP synthase subunit B [Campylobacter pinnipediorum]AQW88059.1 ATP synthase, F0 complex, b subunit [Campylobacter pinnipediorum subsp. caledonicus]OPA71504.1 F0F1 ATP synthase subunit B [Campylobacter pinnipediorum subsp. caledonicus]